MRSKIALSLGGVDGRKEAGGTGNFELVKVEEGAVHNVENSYNFYGALSGSEACWRRQWRWTFASTACNHELSVSGW